MKKYLVLLGAALLVMAVASPSMAQFKSWGHMEIATMWRNQNDFNVGGYNSDGTAKAPDKNLNEKWITQRFRYYLQYGDEKTVRAVIGYEADSSNWGEDRWRIADSGSTNSELTPSGHMGSYGTDQVQSEIKHAFIEFVVPHTPLTVTAGLQGFYMGGRLWQSKDAPGLTVTANFAPHKISAFWWRERDYAFSNYNVNDTYGLYWAMTQKVFNVYAYGAYKNDLATGSNPTIKGTTQAGSATPTGDETYLVPVEVSTPQTREYSADHPWWIGVGGGFRPGNFDLSAQFIYNGGKRDYVTGDDPSYKGWIAEALATYKIGPGMAVSLEGYYATGHDADSTDFKEYTYPSGSEAVWGMGNNRSVFFFYNSDFMYTAGKQLYASGLWYGRVNFEYNPTPWINLNFNYLYIGDTSKGDPANGTVNMISASTSARQDKDESKVGQELNVIAKLKIYQSLYYNIGFGYFFPGDVYDSTDKSAENAFTGITCLRYFF
jgi:hypothetical protein